MSKYRISEFFSRIFDINPDIYKLIRDHMILYGYDEVYPIVLGAGDWTETPVVIDGHTRLKVANELNITPEFITKYFSSEEEALDYAIHNQRDRRNLTAGEISRCVLALEPLKQNYFKKDASGRFVVTEKPYHDPKKLQVFKDSEYDVSISEVAKKLGVSKSTIGRVRKVFSENTPNEIKEAVLNDEISLGKAEEILNEVKEHGQADSTKIYYPTFNFTNSNIEWACWSWNPVTGCQHGCRFCYAIDIANRFYKEKFEYTVHRDRFPAPNNTKIPKGKADDPGIHNVFVCSMADLFGDWVQEDIIQEILDICAATPQWTYIFLTKNPKRLLEFEFPKNSWVGTTVHEKSRVAIALEVMPKVNAPVKFLSCEPLLEDLEIDDLTGIDWIIIGACSKTIRHPEVQPEWKWVWKLTNLAESQGIPVYWKPNLTVVPKEYPSF